MTDIQRQPIIGKSVWKAANFADNSGRDKNQDSIWCHHLTTAEIAACEYSFAYARTAHGESTREGGGRDHRSSDRV